MSNFRPKNLRRLNSAVPSLSPSSLLPLLRPAQKPDSAVRKQVDPTPAVDSDHVSKRKQHHHSPRTTAEDVIDLDDTGALFATFETGKLVRSTLTLGAASFGPAVDLGAAVMGSRLMMESGLFRRAVLGVTERTFFRHFCAGSSLEEARGALDGIWEAGITAMLDYGLEHAGDNDACDANLAGIVETINGSNMFENSAVKFVVVKITAICPPKLLKRVSDLLRWKYKDNSFPLPWKLKSFPIFSTNSPLYHTPITPEPLTPDEERDLQLAHKRLNELCEKSISANIPLLIDAEDTSVQPAIDYLTYSAAIEHTRGFDKPMIYNTIQAYLKDAKERLVIAKKAADKMRVPVGFKLVRGAYMSSEKMLADSLGVNSPVHDGIEKTHDCYNGCADFLLEEIANGSGWVVLATHNVQSGRLAASKAVNLGIEKDSPSLQFAQLYGMAEALSYGLRNAGFRVSKYMPFGPVEQIMPYLLRRAEENRGLLNTSSLDRQLMTNEIFRRLTSSRSKGS